MAVAQPDDPTSMSTGAVADLFKGLAGAVGEFRAVLDADREVADVPDATYDDVDTDDSLEWRDPRAPRWPDLQRALRLARSRLASEGRRRRAEVAREFAAWWADVASVAVCDTADRIPVQVTRAAVGDPSLYMSDEDLRYLPGRSFRSDEPVFVDELAPGPRRDQLWGPDWTYHRVPPLPPAAELASRLTACGVPATAVSEACRGREAIADALEAGQQLGEEPGNEPLELNERLTGLLVDYARGLTEVLRTIWPPPDEATATARP
jgi:hypothetical protein